MLKSQLLDLDGNVLPIFQNDYVKFDKRMASLGFSRSQTQLTPPDADEDCFLWAVLDQVIFLSQYQEGKISFN